MAADSALDHLERWFPSLARSLRQLPDEQWGNVLNAPCYGLVHPLKWLLEGLGKPGSLQAQVLANTGGACQPIPADNNLGSWLSARIREAAFLPDEAEFGAAYDRLAGVYKALSEIRALGYLLRCGLDVIPRAQDGPDFIARSPMGDEIDVEVSALRMTQEEARRLFEFHCRRASCCEEAVIYPAGSPKPGEFTVDNVAHRFSQKAEEKNVQLLKGRPSLLWLDLQFEDWRSLGANEAWPLYILRNGRFRTGGVWLGFYGRPCTSLLESESPVEGVSAAARGVEHTTLRYPGYFEKAEAQAAGVMLSWASCTVLFENPRATHPVPGALLQRLLALPRFDWPRSWVRPFWKASREALEDLGASVGAALHRINGVARIAQLDW